jgi:hypothetical protein
MEIEIKELKDILPLARLPSTLLTCDKLASYIFSLVILIHRVFSKCVKRKTVEFAVYLAAYLPERCYFESKNRI